MNVSEMLKKPEVKLGLKVVLALVALVALVLVFKALFSKDGFCRCNSIGSRVLCDDEHEKLKQLEGAL